ncbi:MAG: hypothetical protein OSJ31_01235 [Alistipes sp.]|nr:hypothetical protein [Alistipes sp.]
MSNTGFLITLVILIAIWISNAKPAKRAAAKRSAARTADKESERNQSSEHDPRNRDLVSESEVAEILIKEDSRIEDFEYRDTFAAVQDTSCSGDKPAMAADRRRKRDCDNERINIDETCATAAADAHRPFNLREAVISYEILKPKFDE